MTQINTNVSSMIAQRVLGQQNQALNQSLERLSTGLRINRGADDPAGLIASENLRSEKVSIDAAIGNAERADQVVNVAEGALQEVNSLLLEAQSLVHQSANDAGLSNEEKEANQEQLDSILQTIDRISASTSFQGTQLLNGTMDFTVSAQHADVEAMDVFAATLGNSNLDVNVMITQSAHHGAVFMDTSGTLALSGTADNPDPKFSFELKGAEGARLFEFADGTSLNEMRDQINNFTDVTGVSATVSGGGLDLRSTAYGSNQFVSVEIMNDAGQAGGISLMDADDNAAADAATEIAFADTTNPIRGIGQDIGATINGATARGQGQELRVNSDVLSLNLRVDDTTAQTLSTFVAGTITGGGARFNIGNTIDHNSEVRLGMGSIAARHLGSTAEGFLNALGSGSSANLVDGDLGQASKILDSAIREVSQMRGRLGAFQQNIVRSTINSLGIAMENVSAAESAIRDADFAEETANMTRAQILANATMATLGVANARPEQVLQLLG
ncbi:MAG: flagellin [Phycisphaeraceae bacterium]